MGDRLLFYVNDRRYEIGGAAAFASLAEFLRQELLLTGTKIVCAEGDCGACTVLVGRVAENGLRYETVDSCIQFLYQLDGKHVVTVEGLSGPGELHPIQRAMIEHHGSQCGFCTPGFVMALAGMVEEKTPALAEAQRTALTGNLCRCTGYLPILEAAATLDGPRLPTLAQRYRSEPIAAELRQKAGDSMRIESGGRTFYAPRTLQEALDFKAGHPDAVIVSGATELGVLRNKKTLDPKVLMSLAHVPGLGEIASSDHTVRIGANVTWRQIEAWAKEAVPEFYQIVLRFGSPQIRNVSTLVGNVAHGSPIADSLPFLSVMDAELELVSSRGSRRVKVNAFYKGYKVKDLAGDEIIAGVHLPLPAPDELLKLYKISRRNDLDIATFGAAIRVRRAGDIITRAYVAYSGVAPAVVRLPGTEAYLQGKLFAEQTFAEAGRRARSEIQPITDVRGSRDFRLLLAENILSKFYYDCLERVAV